MQAKKFWKQASPIVILTIVVTVCVSLLTYIDSITRDKIEAQEDEKVLSMLSSIFPDMSNYEYEDEIYTIYADDVKAGYAFLAIGNGYGGDINIMVALNMDTTIKEISIISQEETPGLGTRIADPSFTGMFTGLDVNDVALSRDGGKIDALTSSTISSSAVVDAVRETALEKIQLLEAKE